MPPQTTQPIMLHEFEPTQEQFELAMRAFDLHARLSNSYDDRVRVPAPLPQPVYVGDQPPPNLVLAMATCWYEKMVLPELLGDEPIDFLHVTYKEDEWWFSPKYMRFMRKGLEVPFYELP